jgi:hypothetical protein
MTNGKFAIRHALAWALALAAIAGAFMLYTRPDFMVQLSNQVWACF